MRPDETPVNQSTVRRLRLNPTVVSIMAVLVMVSAVPLWPDVQESKATSSLPDAAGPTDEAWPKRAATGSVYYASPKGTLTNPGTVGRPIDLATALSAKGPIHAGDVLWLRKGVDRKSVV